MERSRWFALCHWVHNKKEVVQGDKFGGSSWRRRVVMDTLQEFLVWLELFAKELEATDVVRGEDSFGNLMKDYREGYAAGWRSARNSAGSRLRYAVDVAKRKLGG